MSFSQLRNVLLLVLTAAIWGFAFVAQDLGADHLGAFSFLAARSWLAVVVLFPLLCFRSRRIAIQKGLPPLSTGLLRNAAIWKAGTLCGIFLFAASTAQQMGIPMTTTAKAGFITALYVILVPLVSILLGRGLKLQILLCACVATVGLYLLCIKDSLALSSGDSLVMLCAFLFTGHILVIDRVAPGLDGITISWIQFLVTSVLATVCACIFESPAPADFHAALYPVLFAGVLSSGVGYTLQIVGQQGLHPAVAGVAMSLESVFSAIGGWIVLGQALTGRELAGCALMFAAIIASQIPTATTKAEKS